MEIFRSSADDRDWIITLSTAELLIATFIVLVGGAALAYL